MELLHFPLQGAEWYLRMQEQLYKDRVRIAVGGCVDAQKLHLISACNASFQTGLIITIVNCGPERSMRSIASMIRTSICILQRI